ncbi:MAG TPA: SMC-Scp complex subunit ScpB, partial [Chthoniobacteraceae bacterium]|nr:SMC-Scp complex subunit ScpB [Chthoniobacteraceae bacterium]
LVFASPKPLSTKEIIAALKSAGNPEKTEDATAIAYAKTKEDEVLAVLAEIQAELESAGRAFRLMEQVNGWSFVTDPNAVHWVRQLYPEAKPTRLTGPQLETLAIIAYRQPVTRADIEAVRGVAVDSVVQVLMERSLIKIAGRADVPGRPLLYETTEYFLQHFGLKTVHELPNAAELRRVELPKAEHAEPEPPKELTRKGKQKVESAPDQQVTGEIQTENPPEASPENTTNAPMESMPEHPVEVAGEPVKESAFEQSSESPELPESLPSEEPGESTDAPPASANEGSPESKTTTHHDPS